MQLEKRILVVDDDDPIRALVVTVLRRRGLIVDAARNGHDALARMERCHYTLVLLDLMMPRVSGYQVLDHIATLPVDTRPLVILLTAGLEPRAFDSSLVLGTIQKPFDIELLVNAVASTLTTLHPHPQIEPCPSKAAIASFRDDAN